MKKVMIFIILMITLIHVSIFSKIVDFQLIIDDPNIKVGSIEYYSIVIPKYMELDFLDNAEVELDNAVRHYPEEALFYYLYEVLMFKKGDTGSSNKYRNLTFLKDKLVTNSEDSYIHRAKTFLELKEYEIALKEIDAGIIKYPDSADMYFTKGKVIFYYNNIEEEIKNYSKAIDLDQNNPEFNFVRAGAYSDSGNYIESTNDYIVCINKNYKISDSYSNIGLNYQRLKEYDLAIQNYEKSIFYDSHNVPSYTNMSNIFSTLGKYQKAIDTLKEGLAIDGNNIIALLNLGRNYGIIEKYNDAIKIYSKVIEIQPNNIYALYNRGSCYYKIGSDEKGKIDQEKAKSLNEQK